MDCKWKSFGCHAQVNSSDFDHHSEVCEFNEAQHKKCPKCNYSGLFYKDNCPECTMRIHEELKKERDGLFEEHRRRRDELIGLQLEQLQMELDCLRVEVRLLFVCDFST